MTDYYKMQQDMLSSNLKNQLTLITGGFGNIGYKISEYIMKKGSKLIIFDIIENKEKLEELQKIGEVYFYKTNLENRNNLLENLNDIIQKFDKIDGIINCAAFVGDSKVKGLIGSIEEQSIDTWDKVLNVNLTVPFIIIKTLFPMLKKSDNSSIINISSIYGKVGNVLSIYEGTKYSTSASYSACKGGLNQLTNYFASIFGSDKIRVNTVSPGGIYRNHSDIFVKNYENIVPMKRMGVENDLVGIIGFLLSNESRYITGANIPVDGGWCSI